MLNPNVGAGAEVENFGGSTRVNGEAVFLRLRIPMRFLVGERPAGADRGEDFETAVLSFGAGERGWRIGLVVEVGLRELEKSLSVGGGLVRKNWEVAGLRTSLVVPSRPLERLGERKIMGSMFSESSS
jgi:hypothetical protein